MRLALLAGDVVLLALGVVVLLYGFRVLGKPPGADERYDDAMTHKGVIYKACGWCAVVAAALGLVGCLADTSW
jgi:hypothetical protein